MKRTPLQNVSMEAGILRVVQGRVRPLLERSLLTVTPMQLAMDAYTQGMSDTLQLAERGRLPYQKPAQQDYQI